MRRARVALVVPTFPARSETFIVSKATGLIAAGWDVHVVCQRLDRVLLGDTPLATRQALRGRIHAAWPHRPRWFAAALVPLSLVRCLARRPLTTARYFARGGTLRQMYLDSELIRVAPRIIHFEFGTLALGRMHVGRALGTKTIVSFRGFDLNFVGLEDPDFFASVWNGATAIHTLGEDLWRRAQRRGCPASKPHALVSPAIDVSEFEPGTREHIEPAGTEVRPLRIVSVGRLEWKKGYEYALEAIRLLVGRGIRCEYRIVGTGGFHTAVAYARYQLGLTEVVTLLGSCSPSEVRSQLGWADVMLHPAVSEGFGNAVIEGQAMELPIVCTTADGLRENVADGETGIIVPTRDPAGIADALERLGREPEMRRRMGTAGRARVLSRFRLSDQIAAFSALYERVLAQDALAEGGSQGLSLENDAAR